MGVSFAVPMREQMHNRHVRFTGDGGGVWAEALQPATGGARCPTAGFSLQIEGKPQYRSVNCCKPGHAATAALVCASKTRLPPRVPRTETVRPCQSERYCR